MDLELLPGSGTRKIQSWIRIRNKSFRIHNTAFYTVHVTEWQFSRNPFSEFVFFFAVLRSRSRKYLRPVAGAEIIFLINVSCSQF